MVRKILGGKKSKKHKKTNIQNEIPSIIVECPSGNKLQYVDDWDFVKVSQNENNNPDLEEIKIISERKNSLRRNSVSLPNLDNLELQIIKVNAVSVFILIRVNSETK